MAFFIFLWGSIGLLFVILLWPITFRFCSQPFKVEIRIFPFKKLLTGPKKKEGKEKKSRLKKKEKAKAKKTKKETSGKKSAQKTGAKKRKRSWKDYYRLLRDPEFRQVIRKSLLALIRFFKAFRIARLRWKIGLKDFYHQGILESILLHLPQQGRICIQGNFLEENFFFLQIRTNLLRLIFRILVLLCSIPWLQIYRQIRKFKTGGNLNIT